jgi:hypothetical protein
MEIRGGTLRIGHEAYQLRNIARVSAFTLEKVYANSGLVVLVLFGLALMLLAAGSEVPGGIGVIGFAVAAISGLVLLNRYLEQNRLHVLCVEPCGVPPRILVSGDLHQLVGAREFILKAIEDPPDRPISWTLNNIHVGDKTTINGDHNIGKIVNGGGFHR